MYNGLNIIQFESEREVKKYCHISSDTSSFIIDGRPIFRSSVETGRPFWTAAAVIGFILQSGGWFNTGPCCNALTPTQHVSGTLNEPLCTKCEYLPFWYRIFNMKFWCESRFSTWQTGTSNCEVSSNQVKNEFASQITKLFHFQNFVFLTVFSLLAATKVEI